MKIKGNMAKAMKFNPSVLPKDAKLWQALLYKQFKFDFWTIKNGI
jgi:hypothetical protein